jgi:hypothetical protein
MAGCILWFFEGESAQRCTPEAFSCEREALRARWGTAAKIAALQFSETVHPFLVPCGTELAIVGRPSWPPRGIGWDSAVTAELPTA